MRAAARGWFVRISKPDGKPDVESFNPLGWGTLFFTLWVSVKMAKEIRPGWLNDVRDGFEWIFLGWSVILCLSIFYPPLESVLQSRKATQKYMYAVFLATLSGYVFGWLPGFGLEGVYQDLALGVGFLWLTTYVLVALSRLNSVLYRAIFCLAFVGIWINALARYGFLGTSPLFALSIAVWWPCVRPNRFRSISII